VFATIVSRAAHRRDQIDEIDVVAPGRPTPRRTLQLMPILVTLSVNLAESVSLLELRQFVDTAERHGADFDVDLREYDENGDLVGLAAVGQLELSGEGGSAGDTLDKLGGEDSANEDDSHADGSDQDERDEEGGPAPG
jgi:hypothetical protein